MEENHKTSYLDNLIWAIVIIGIVWWFMRGKQQAWRGFYYPGGVISGPAIYSPEYKTKEDCISWAENEWKLRPQDSLLDPQDLYECGKNCKVRNKEIGLHVCDQTFDGGDWRRGDYGE